MRLSQPFLILAMLLVVSLSLLLSQKGCGRTSLGGSVGSGRARPGIDRAGQGSIGQGIIRINARALGPDGRQGRAGQGKGLGPGFAILSYQDTFRCKFIRICIHGNK
ncbi:hypothetical protein C8J56DRAFT_892273 [Mycena floridula]|nr:hypothetical protein C8J56DRAFT_892273 [Mycena floridula]